MIIGNPHVIDGTVVDQEGNELVCRRSTHQSTRRYHLITPEAFRSGEIRPQCSMPTQQNTDWRLCLSTDIEPVWECCQRCSGFEQEQFATGPRLDRKLAAMSPTEFDEKAGIEDSWATKSLQNRQRGSDQQ